jgi:cbb3-type cytochrome oxidase subunit 3
MYIANHPLMTVLSLPVLESTGQDMDIRWNNRLPSLHLPALTTIGAYLSVANNDLLSTLSLPRLSLIQTYVRVHTLPFLSEFILCSDPVIGGAGSPTATWAPLPSLACNAFDSLPNTRTAAHTPAGAANFASNCDDTVFLSPTRYAFVTGCPQVCPDPYAYGATCNETVSNAQCLPVGLGGDGGVFSAGRSGTGACEVCADDTTHYGVSCGACPGLRRVADSVLACTGQGTCDGGVAGNGTCECSPTLNADVLDSTTCDCIPGRYGQACPYVCDDCTRVWNRPDAVCDDGVEGSGACLCGGVPCNCAPGWYGAGCTSTCVDCPAKFGDARAVCDDGVTGSGMCLCNTTECACGTGTWGWGCAETCVDCAAKYADPNAVCSPVDGTCLCDGTPCVPPPVFLRERPVFLGLGMTALVASSVALFFFLLALFFYCTIWRRRHRRKKRMNARRAAYTGGGGGVTKVISDADDIKAYLKDRFESGSTKQIGEGGAAVVYRMKVSVISTCIIYIHICMFVCDV